MDTKKIITYILIFLAIIIAGMFFIYNYYTKPVVDVNGVVKPAKKLTIFGITIGGGNGTTTTTEVSTSTATTTQEQEGVADILKLRELSQSAVAGFISFEDVNKETKVRYMEKSTGNVYEIGTNSSTQKRITNTTIPRVSEAIWLDPNSLIVRYLDEDNVIKTFYAAIKDLESGATEQKIEGTFLQDDIKEIVPINGKIFYLTNTSSGSQGVLSKQNGSGKTLIFDSLLKEWLISAPEKNTVVFNTKPSFNFFGYAYFFNVTKQTMTKILQDVRGLTILGNANKTGVLFSESGNNSFSLNYYDVSKKTRKEMVIKTLPEKCVWAKDNKVVFCGVPTSIARGGYPDVWYQGLILFSDNIWKIDVENNLARALISPKDFANKEIDLIKPSLSQDENYLFFVNKKDSMLWSLELK